jgi:hypothetical protein
MHEIGGERHQPVYQTTYEVTTVDFANPVLFFWYFRYDKPFHNGRVPNVIECRFVFQ